MPEERMTEYTERIQREMAERRAEKGEVVPAEETAGDVQRRHSAAIRSEAETVDQLRDNLGKAALIEADMLERIAETKGIRDLPAALRAVSDVKSKSLDGLLKLTGRAPSESESNSIEQLLVGMANKGYLRVNVELGRPDE